MVPMSIPPPTHSAFGFLSHHHFPQLLEALHSEGYRILAPVVTDGSVKWAQIRGVEDLAIGWRDHQEPGRYRLERTASHRLFDIVHGPDSLKREVFVPREPLLVIDKKKHAFEATPLLPDPDRIAVLGVRSCDLSGLEIQDRIFLHGPYPDPYYRRRRENLFLVAVNCTRALPTCFCASMNTGPKAQRGYDLVMTESDDGFLMQAGSVLGRGIYERLPLSRVNEDRVQADDQRMMACAESQTRRVPRELFPQVLYDAHDHPHWDSVAARCVSCANCTLVCPTCFCHAAEVTTDLERERSEHARVWDSCFTPDHGYIHGKNFRPTIKDRYRMWLTHKMASWIDQFGVSGCVGCGRCITWCPVGIDLTEELNTLCQSDSHP